MRQQVRELLENAHNPEVAKERKRRVRFISRIPLRGGVSVARVKNETGAGNPRNADWTRRYIALALESCANCKGTGARIGHRARLCGCVTRAIFTALHRKYHGIATRMEAVSSCVPTAVIGGEGAHFVWGMKNEEFSADFYLLAERVLDARSFQIFRLHIIDGWDWRYCCERLGIDRGTFFHVVYRIRETVGLAAVELKPYPLYPIEEYFGVHEICSRGPFVHGYDGHREQ